MTRVSLHAALVGIGLSLAVTTQVAQAGGHFHHNKTSYSTQTFGVTQMAMPTVGVTQMAMPMVGVTQMAMPTMSVSQMAMPTMSVSQMAMPMVGVTQMALPMTPQAAYMTPAFGQSQQAQSFDAVPQFGISDITAILDLLGRVRNGLARNGGGNIGPVNPGNGGNGVSGSCPEVRVIICNGGTAKVAGGASVGANNGAIGNDALDNLVNQAVNQLAQNMVAQATAQAAKATPQTQTPAAALAVPAPNPGGDKEAQVKAILDEIDALKAKVNALK